MEETGQGKEEEAREQASLEGPVVSCWTRDEKESRVIQGVFDMLSGCWSWRTLWEVVSRLLVRALVFSSPFSLLSLRGVSGPSRGFPLFLSLLHSLAYVVDCRIGSRSGNFVRIAGASAAEDILQAELSSNPSSERSSDKSSRLRAHQMSVRDSLR